MQQVDCCYGVKILRVAPGRERAPLLLVALNFAEHAQQLDISAAANGQIVLSTYLDRKEEVPQAGLMLRSHEGSRLRKLHGSDW